MLDEILTQKVQTKSGLGPKSSQNMFGPVRTVSLPRVLVVDDP